jgi:group I intron endonuclease
MFNVYKITNRLNGKIYVGITTGTVKTRWWGHCQAARNVTNKKTKRHSCGLISKEMHSVGIENFQIDLLDSSATNWKELADLELKYISEINSGVPNGYNIKTLHQGNTTHTPESKAAISAAHKGKPKSPEHRAKISATVTRINSDPAVREHLRQKALNHQNPTCWKSIIRIDPQTGEEKEFEALSHIIKEMGFRDCVRGRIRAMCNNRIVKDKRRKNQKVNTHVKGYVWKWKYEGGVNPGGIYDKKEN